MKTLAEFMAFADKIGDGVRDIVTGLELKMASRLEAINGSLAELKAAQSDVATKEALEAVSAAIGLQAEDLRNEIETRVKAPELVQVKSVSGDGGSLLVELSNGEFTEIALPAPIPGKDGSNGVDGKDGAPGKDGMPGEDGKDGADGYSGQDGKDGLDGAPGADGKDGLPGVDGKDGRDGVDGKDGVGIVEVKQIDGEAAVFLTSNGSEYRIELPKPAQPAAPADPVDIREAMIDRNGNLVLVFSNGVAKDVGPIVGRDGINGRDGVDGINGRDGIDGLNGLDGAPGLTGEPGRPGLDGRDGFGFDDMEARLEEDGRTITFAFVRGDVVKEFGFKFPVSIYRGAYEPGRAYDVGDVVSFTGNTYSATKETVGIAPESGDGTWLQATAAGRSLRGPRGIAGKDGRNGVDGKDFTPRS